MRALARTTWVELKLFPREPLTVAVTLGLPLVLLFVLGGVFGNTHDPEVYRGVGPMDYYVPAYIWLVIASLGIVGLPAHLSAYRERGVLRRFVASSVPMWAVIGAQVMVTLVVAFLGSVLLITVASVTYDIHFPSSVPLVVGGFFLSGLSFSAIGVFLGSAFPTARAAQGAGLMLWFVMMILGGAGPPPEVLTEGMRALGDATPVRHVILLLQDAWLGFGWNWTETLIVAVFMAGGGGGGDALPPGGGGGGGGGPPPPAGGGAAARRRSSASEGPPPISSNLARGAPGARIAI